MRRRRWTIPIWTTVMLVLAACGGQDQPPTAGDGGSAPRGERTWLAVFEVAADPDDLDDATQELLDGAGKATVVAPEICFRGWLDELEVTPGTYVLGVMAPTEERLGSVVEEAGREPIFTGEVVDTCGS